MKKPTRWSKPMVIRIFFAWYDFWVGFYYDRTGQILYFCPLPMLVIAWHIGVVDDG